MELKEEYEELESLTSELQRAQKSVTSLCDLARQRHISRVKIYSEILKYPNIDDYVVRAPAFLLVIHSLIELCSRLFSENMTHGARYTTFEPCQYAMLTDIVYRNITKIFSPNALHSNHQTNANIARISGVEFSGRQHCSTNSLSVRVQSPLVEPPINPLPPACAITPLCP